MRVMYSTPTGLRAVRVDTEQGVALSKGYFRPTALSAVPAKLLQLCFASTTGTSFLYALIHPGTAL